MRDAGRHALSQSSSWLARPIPIATCAMGEERLSYAEALMRGRTGSRAWLIRRGIGPEDVVALGMRRTPRAIAAIIGVEKAGAAYLPIDPTTP